MEYNEQELNRLIDLYFEGLTSLGQERQLRDMLADSRYRSPGADEARAVLGVSAILEQPGRTHNRRPWLRRAAAVTTGLIAAGSVIGYFADGPDHTSPGDCYAYVGTELVQNPDEVLLMMHRQLADMSEVADQVNRDLENSIETFKIPEQ